MKLLKLILVCYYAKLSSGQCTIPRSLFGDYIPLLVRTSNSQPVRLNNANEFTFLQNEDVIVGCPNANVFLAGTGNTGRNSIRLKCQNGDIFRNTNNQVNLNQVTCGMRPNNNYSPIIRQIGNCHRGLLISVGYEPENEMVESFRTCYNQNLHQVQYTIYNLYPDVQQGRYSSRPLWFGTTINDVEIVNGRNFRVLYSDNEYRPKFIQLLGNRTIYFQSKDIISKGHIVPFGDYLYAIQRGSTMVFINAAPQWTAINGGSWQRLETNIRQYSRNNRRILTIVTGTWGILQLPNDNGRMVNMFLGNQQIPIPSLYWKAVWDRDANAGKVFISINNPFAENLTPMCTNVCPNNAQDIRRGFIYCCRVKDFFDMNEFRPFREAYGFNPRNELVLDPFLIN